MEKAKNDFAALWASFSMAQLETTVGDVADAITSLKSAFQACDVDAIVGSSLTSDLMTAAAGLVSGAASRSCCVCVCVCFACGPRCFAGRLCFSFASFMRALLACTWSR